MIKPVKNQSVKKIKPMNKKIIRLANRVLAKFGYHLERIKTGSIFRSEHVHDPQYSYINEPGLRDKLAEELSAIARPFLERHFAGLIDPDFFSPELVTKFITLFADRPYRNNTGGSGFHNSFWIYLFTTAFKPDLIVESGVWKGHTSWLFNQAAPDAKILGFDINLKHLEFSHSSADFIEADWTTYQFSEVDPNRSVIFFDCHVNHAQRIIEAKERGFKHLLIDDNPPLYKIYSYGQPGFPTAQMLHNSEYPRENPFTWVWKRKSLQANLDLSQAQEASKLIKKHLVFPDVGGPTRFGGFSFLTYVEI